jgi:probable HAF family extracellular repeat protein
VKSRSLSASIAPALLSLVLSQSFFSSAGELLLEGGPRFEVEDLGTLPGDDYSVANKVNNRGEVVGISARRVGSENFRNRAFLYRNGRLTALGTLDGVGSAAFNLNDNGDVVGMTYRADGRYVPFLYTGGQMTNLEALTGVSGVWQLTPAAINNAGKIVGSAYDRQSGASVPFYYTGSQLILLTNHPPGIYPSGSAGDINESGLACGASDLGMARYVAVYISETAVIPIPLVQTVPGETYGWAVNNSGHLLGGLNGNNFIYHDGELTLLGPFREQYQAWARDMNDSDDVVGDNEQVPFLCHGRAIYYLNEHIREHSGWLLQGAYGLNNRGQITGFGLHHKKTRAYLLTPMPTDGSAVSTGLNQQP